MARIDPIDPTQADENTQAALDEAAAAFGRPWLICQAMANNPGVLRAFLAFNGSLEGCGLSAGERELVSVEMAVANGCHYCVPAHRFAARQQSVDVAVIDAVGRGETLQGDTPEAVLQRLVRRLAATKGKLSDAEFAAFEDAGITQAKMIAVIAEMANCLLTNYFNRLAATDIDDFLEPYR